MTRFMTGLLLCMVLLPTVAHAALGDTAETIDRRGTFRGPVTAPDTLYARLPARSLWLERTLFNMTASFLGVPGLASPVDGLSDEGLGLHADGTTRRAGGADSASGFGGQRAASYMRSGQYGPYGGGAFHQPWLYDDLMGFQRGPDGRLLRPGSEYSRQRYGGYGGGYGSGLPGGSMGESFAHSLLQRGVSYGMGLANTAAESAILGLMGSGSPYGNGKARLNFNLYVDDKGNSRFGGEGDVLWPLYDNPYTTIYTQFGARSMYGGGDKYGPDRWIGNFGLGQRWFPGAKMTEDGKVDSGNWMVGYNAFFDYDITRGHQRGGLGVEAQYDWLKLASNWYFPLSDWKDSKDFDGRFVQERAAQGWDLRAKGYLPFYREIAITGSYTQWYGDHVGMFGPSKLEKNPKVWSYGIEYTPVPALTAFVNQRQTERGRADTEFGLRFTYHFGMDAESQFKPSRVAQMRTVHGARHDFVDRENKIILEYRAKNRFHIEYLGFQGNAFVFRIRNGFDKYVAGQTVHVTASGAVLALAPPASTVPQTFFARAVQALDDLFSIAVAHAGVLSKSYQSDGGGTVRIPVDAGTGPVTLTLQVGDTTQSFTVSGGGGGGNLTLAVTGGSAFVSGSSSTATVTATATDASGNNVTINSGDIRWTVESSSITAGWWGNRAPGNTNGLAWGSTAISLNVAEVARSDMSGNGGTAPTGASAQLTDIVGSRTVVVKAVMTISGTAYTQTATVTFGAGPLSVFAGKPKGNNTWAGAISACGGTGDINTAGYQASTKLPTIAQLKSVAGSGSGGNKGAAHAAGWPDDTYGLGWFDYWTGEASGDGGNARIVGLDDGGGLWSHATSSGPVAVCLP